VKLERIKEGDSVYVCAYTLQNFLTNLLPKIKSNIVLVTGDSDVSIELNETVKSIILCPKIIMWFAQNCMIKHHKLIHMPIGLDYHNMAWYNRYTTFYGPIMTPLEQELQIKELISVSKPSDQRLCKIYSTFHFFLERGDRREAYEQIPKELIDYEENQTSRYNTHIKQLNYAFVASPFGGGPDCYRTWEALLLGCIPIIKSSGLNPVFEGLPMLIIEKWSDLTQELLQETLNKLSKFDRFYYRNKMLLAFWKELFHIYGKEHLKLLI
jgi:hypothetical protein